MTFEIDNDIPIPPGRDVSTIGFPYVDLDEAIKVARAIHERGGGVPLERDQVSVALNSAGGTLAVKLSAGRHFGLIDSAQGKWSLTPLGYEIIEPSRERAAKVQAFLNVELYKRVFDEMRGRLLPAKGGLEHAFTTYGVAPKQKVKARQTFERSARSAGFFPNGNEDRLVQPVTSPASAQVPDEGQVTKPSLINAEVAQVAATPIKMHPFIDGLLQTLPLAQTDWDSEGRAKWLRAAAQIFDLLYSGGDGDVVVEVKSAK